MKNLKIYTLLFFLSSAFFAAKANTQVAPRLLVNIVVSSMHADDLDKYSANFSSGGFRRLMNNGAWFTNASYDYMQTTTPVSLATISTGAMPSVHGVVADRWFDYVGNKQVMLIDDKKEQSVNYSGGSGGYSPRNLTAQTLSEVVAQSNSKSHVATIAIEPLSAIVMAGKAGDVYWMETKYATRVSVSFHLFFALLYHTTPRLSSVAGAAFLSILQDFFMDLSLTDTARGAIMRGREDPTFFATEKETLCILSRDTTRRCPGRRLPLRL